MEKIKRIIVGCIFILPVLQYYTAPFLVDNLAFFLQIILLLLMILITVNDKWVMKRLGAPFFFISFIGWSILTTLIAWLQSYSSSIENLNITFSFLIYAAMSFYGLQLNLEQSRKIIRFYGWLVKIFCIISLIQYVLYYTIDYVWICKIPFLTLEEFYNPEVFGTITYTWTPIAHLSGVFAEPAHLSLYTLPYLVLLLFKEEVLNIKQWTEAIFITICIFLTTSGTGIVAAAMIWAFFLLKRDTKKLQGNQEWAIKIILICILAIAAHLFLLKTSVNYEHLIRTLFVTTPGEQSKSSYRIWRGIDVFSQLPLGRKCIGIGYKNYVNYAQMNEISSVYDVEGVNGEYFSGIFQVLIYFGIVGLILMCGFWIQLYKNSCKAGKILIIVFVSLFVASSALMEMTWQTFVFAIGLANTYSVRKKEGEAYEKDEYG